MAGACTAVAQRQLNRQDCNSIKMTTALAVAQPMQDNNIDRAHLASTAIQFMWQHQPESRGAEVEEGALCMRGWGGALPCGSRVSGQCCRCAPRRCARHPRVVIWARRGRTVARRAAKWLLFGRSRRHPTTTAQWPGLPGTISPSMIFTMVEGGDQGTLSCDAAQGWQSVGSWRSAATPRPGLAAPGRLLASEAAADALLQTRRTPSALQRRLCRRSAATNNAWLDHRLFEPISVRSARRDRPREPSGWACPCAASPRRAANEQEPHHLCSASAATGIALTCYALFDLNGYFTKAPGSAQGGSICQPSGSGRWCVQHNRNTVQ